ncbi:MAG: hypothetical protein GWO24_07070, partial [Akkermansiaceae bacterium]|nr:hypothetical protein [Akkermansiaceae bacterium]
PRFLITVSTFPGLEYELETSPDLRNGFSAIPASRFIADSHSPTFEVQLALPREFIRARRR